MAAKSIEHDSDFVYLDQSVSKELGHVECYENRLTGEIIAKKVIDLGKLLNSPEEISILNSVLSLQPKELSPASEDYLKLVHKDVFPQLSLSKKFQVYFLDSSITLDGVVHYLKEQNKKIDDSDAFVILGFLMAAGIMMEEHLGFHPCIYPSSLLVTAQNRLTLMHPLMYEAYLTAMATDIVPLISQAGNSWHPDFFKNQEKREIFAETLRIKPQADQNTKVSVIVDNHRRLVSATIDSMCHTILSIVSGVDVADMITEDGAADVGNVENAIGIAREKTDSELVDLLRHVLMVQAYESFKTLDEYINSMPSLKAKIIRYLNSSPLTAKFEPPGGMLDSTLTKAVKQLASRNRDELQSSELLTGNSSYVNDSSLHNLTEQKTKGNPDSWGSKQHMMSPLELDDIKTLNEESEKREKPSKEKGGAPNQQESQGWKGVHAPSFPSPPPLMPFHGPMGALPFMPPPGMMSPPTLYGSSPIPSPFQMPGPRPIHPMPPFGMPPAPGQMPVPPATWTPPQRPLAGMIIPKVVDQFKEFTPQNDGDIKSTSKNPFTGDTDKVAENGENAIGQGKKDGEGPKFGTEAKSSDNKLIQEILAYTKRLEQQIEAQRVLIEKTHAIQKQQQEVNERQSKQMEELKKMILSRPLGEVKDGHSEAQNVNQNIPSNIQEPPKYNPHKTPPPRLTNHSSNNLEQKSPPGHDSPKAEPKVAQNPAIENSNSPANRPRTMIRGRRMPASISFASRLIPPEMNASPFSPHHPFRGHHQPFSNIINTQNPYFKPVHMSSPRPIVTDKPPQVLMRKTYTPGMTDSQTSIESVVPDKHYVYDEFGQKVYLQDTSISTLARYRHVGARPLGGASAIHYPRHFPLKATTAATHRPTTTASRNDDAQSTASIVRGVSAGTGRGGLALTTPRDRLGTNPMNGSFFWPQTPKSRENTGHTGFLQGFGLDDTSEKMNTSVAEKIQIFGRTGLGASINKSSIIDRHRHTKTHN